MIMYVALTHSVRLVAIVVACLLTLGSGRRSLAPYHDVTLRIHFDGYIGATPSLHHDHGFLPAVRRAAMKAAASIMTMTADTCIRMVVSSPGADGDVVPFLHDFALLHIAWKCALVPRSNSSSSHPHPPPVFDEVVEHVRQGLQRCFSAKSTVLQNMEAEEAPHGQACSHLDRRRLGGFALPDGRVLRVLGIAEDSHIRQLLNHHDPQPLSSADGRKVLFERNNANTDEHERVVALTSTDVAHPVDILGMDALWSTFPNAMGQEVHVALLDTGLSVNNPHFPSLIGDDNGAIASCMTFTDDVPPAGSTRSSWCGDAHGHGTFGASLIAGQGDRVNFGAAAAAAAPGSHGGCRKSQPDVSQLNRTFNRDSRSRRGGLPPINGVGLAPKARLHIFKVFTDTQVSLTSWVLAAFNAAMQLRVDIINLSFGGMDYYDDMFVEKVREVTAAGITIVTASGNDGPRQGSVFNPADQAEVIAVGSVALRRRAATTSISKAPYRAVSEFSSRGMTTWELPFGVGRPRPDVLGYGDKVVGASSLRAKRSCRVLSGTSMASPVVAGVLAVITSALKAFQPSMILPRDGRGKTKINVALLKQILHASSDVISLCEEETFAVGHSRACKSSTFLTISDLRKASLYSQGSGVINASRALNYVWGVATSSSTSAASRRLPGSLASAVGMDKLLRITAYPERVIAVSTLRDATSERATAAFSKGTTYLYSDLFGQSSTVPPTAASAAGLSASDAPFLWPSILRSGGVFLTSSPLLSNITLYSSGSADAAFESFRVVFDSNRTFAFSSPLPNEGSSAGRGVPLSASAAESLLRVTVKPHRPSLHAHVGYVTLGFWTPTELPSGVGKVRVQGTVSLTYVSRRPPNSDNHDDSSQLRQQWTVDVPFTVDVTRPPHRSRRLLWDTTTQLLYPGAFVPRDNVREQNRFSDFADWGGDHPLTNFVHLYEHLAVRRGLVIDFVHHRDFYDNDESSISNQTSPRVAAMGLPVVDDGGGGHHRGDLASRCARDHIRYHPLRMYQYLLVVDPEDYFSDAFLSTVECGVKHHGLRLLLASDWADDDIMRLSAFVDPATKLFHEPVTGGTNVVAINQLMRRFGAVQSRRCVISGPLRSHDGTFLAMVSSGGCVAAAGNSSLVSGSDHEEGIGCSIAAREMHNDVEELKQLDSQRSQQRPANAKVRRGGAPVMWSDSRIGHGRGGFDADRPPLSFVLRRYCPIGFPHQLSVDVNAAREPQQRAPSKEHRRAAIPIVDADQPTTTTHGQQTPVDKSAFALCGGVFFFADSDCLDGMHHYEAGGAPSSHMHCTNFIDAALDVFDEQWHPTNVDGAASALALGLTGEHCHPLKPLRNGDSLIVEPNFPTRYPSPPDSDPLRYTSRRYRAYHTTITPGFASGVNGEKSYMRSCHVWPNDSRNNDARGRRPAPRCPLERWETEDFLADALQGWLDHNRRESRRALQSVTLVPQREARRQSGRGGPSSEQQAHQRIGVIAVAMFLCFVAWRRWLRGYRRRKRSAAAALGRRGTLV